MSLSSDTIEMVENQLQEKQKLFEAKMADKTAQYQAQLDQAKAQVQAEVANYKSQKGSQLEAEVLRAQVSAKDQLTQSQENFLEELSKAKDALVSKIVEEVVSQYGGF